jgi:hypothetical protein
VEQLGLALNVPEYSVERMQVPDSAACKGVVVKGRQFVVANLEVQMNLRLIITRINVADNVI